MSEQHVLSGPSHEPDLDQHLAAFVASLARVGYNEKTQRDKVRRSTLFLQWLRQTGVSLGEV
jgi:hypothetical protein